MFCEDISLQSKFDIKNLCIGSTVSNDNFSYDLIDRQISISHNQQMVIFEELIVEDELILEGRIYLNE